MECQVITAILNGEQRVREDEYLRRECERDCRDVQPPRPRRLQALIGFLAHRRTATSPAIKSCHVTGARGFVSGVLWFALTALIGLLSLEAAVPTTTTTFIVRARPQKVPIPAPGHPFPAFQLQKSNDVPGTQEYSFLVRHHDASTARLALQRPALVIRFYRDAAPNWQAEKAAGHHLLMQWIFTNLAMTQQRHTTHESHPMVMFSFTYRQLTM